MENFALTFVLKLDQTRGINIRLNIDKAVDKISAANKSWYER